jgi:hypothetical protein
LRRRLFGLLGLVLALLFVLRLFGVRVVPGSWLVAGWIVDAALGLLELAVVLAAARAFREGRREGGLLRGYERWIEKEEELGLPPPLARLMQAELRFYERVFGRRR